MVTRPKLWEFFDCLLGPLCHAMFRVCSYLVDKEKGEKRAKWLWRSSWFFFSYLSLEFSNICLINEIATDLVRLCPIKMILQWPSFLQLGLMASVLFWGQDIFFFILDFLINFPSNYWVEYSLMIYTTASHVELRVKSNKRKMFRWMEFPAGELELSIKFALSKSKGKVTPLFPWLIVSTHQQRNLHFRQRRRETRWRRGAKTHPMAEAARAPPSQWDLRYHIWILSGTSGNKKQGSMPTYCSQCFQTTLKRRKSIELHFRS